MLLFIILCYSTFVSLFFFFFRWKTISIGKRNHKMYIIKLFAISFWNAMIPRTLHQSNRSTKSSNQSARRFALFHGLLAHVTIILYFFLFKSCSVWTWTTSNKITYKVRISRPNGETAAQICVSFVTMKNKTDRKYKWKSPASGHHSVPWSQHIFIQTSNSIWLHIYEYFPYLFLHSSSKDYVSAENRLSLSLSFSGWCAFWNIITTERI